MCSIKKENKRKMSAPSNVEGFLKSKGERIISDIVGVITTNAVAGRSSFSKESFQDAIQFVASEFLYSNFVKAYIQPFLTSGMSGAYGNIVNDLIELLVIVVQIYVFERYVMRRQVNMMRLFLETATATAISDRVAMAIKF